MGEVLAISFSHCSISIEPYAKNEFEQAGIDPIETAY